ncbi:MAG: DUF4184 family protein [Crocinitomicaceae bacterium]
MPFTFSHPAIILPLSKIHKSKLSLTGLIAGSLAPDFEYFIFMKMRRTHGHELTSFLWFNLPICIGLALVYHGIIKKPLIKSLPHFLYQRLCNQKNNDWFSYFKKYWFVFIYSAAIGVFSHIFWDSFTHDNGIIGKSPDFLLEVIPVLNQRVYEFLQLASTMVGGIYVLYFIQKLPIQPTHKLPILEKIMFWMNVLILMTTIFTINTPANISEFIAVTIGSFVYGIVGSSIYHSIYEKIYSKRATKF